MENEFSGKWDFRKVRFWESEILGKVDFDLGEWDFGKGVKENWILDRWNFFKMAF